MRIVKTRNVDRALQAISLCSLGEVWRRKSSKLSQPRLRRITRIWNDILFGARLRVPVRVPVASTFAENTVWLETQFSVWKHCLLNDTLVEIKRSNYRSDRGTHSDQCDRRRDLSTGFLIKDTMVVGSEPWHPRSLRYLPTNGEWRRRLIGFRCILGSFQLDLQPFHADLETVHRLDRCLRARRVVVRHEAWK